MQAAGPAEDKLGVQAPWWAWALMAWVVVLILARVGGCQQPGGDSDHQVRSATLAMDSIGRTANSTSIAVPTVVLLFHGSSEWDLLAHQADSQQSDPTPADNDANPLHEPCWPA